MHALRPPDGFGAPRSVSEARVFLPGVLGDIARAAGEEAALSIAQKFGGTRVYIPSKPRADHWLCGLVGEEAAQAIGDELTGGFIGGARIDLPIGPAGHQETARAKVDRMIKDGASERDIALASRYTTRGVRKRKAKLRDDTQASLFD